MPLHLIKLSVGAEGVDDLEYWIERRVRENEKTQWGRVSHHVTRMYPRRRDELLDGGSLYWVIKGVVQARQKIVGLEPVTGEDGIERCAILLDPCLVPVEPQPKRAFQGWRYLRPEDAPRDMKKGAGRVEAALRAELAELGLL